MAGVHLTIWRFWQPYISLSISSCTYRQLHWLLLPIFLRVSISLRKFHSFRVKPVWCHCQVYLA
jgi:hypothetical protein